MGWRDRDYAREGTGGFGDNPLMWLLRGRVPLFEVFGIRVVAHASLIVISVLVLLLGTPFGASPLDRLTFVVVLFGVVLLHEFGHAFAARWSGGEAREVELTPLGGLALTMPGKGWRRHTITIAGGPLVNVLICLLCGGVLAATAGTVPFGPFEFQVFDLTDPDGRPAWFTPGLFNVAFYAYYVYSVSYFLLLFNLLPVYPLDGGQLLQGLLWSRLGWYKATMIATGIGLVGAVLIVMFGLASGGVGALLLAGIGISCFINCLSLRRQLKAEGPWGFAENDEPDWMASVNMDPDEGEKETVRQRLARRRAERRAATEAEAAERLERDVDAVLAKISRSGMDSLTAAERRTLERGRQARSRV